MDGAALFSMLRRRSTAEIIAFRRLQSFLATLPPEIRDACEECSIELVQMADSLEEEPDLDPELLGLFEGRCYADPEPLLPGDMPRIRIFVDVLWDYAGGNPQVFAEEVRTTFLHELGHFLGWEEDEIEARGLA
jgi:predicted Zn-dependent protease with MMP-like domain